METGTVKFFNTTGASGSSRRRAGKRTCSSTLPIWSGRGASRTASRSSSKWPRVPRGRKRRTSGPSEARRIRPGRPQALVARRASTAGTAAVPNGAPHRIRAGGNLADSNHDRTGASRVPPPDPRRPSRGPLRTPARLLLGQGRRHRRRVRRGMVGVLPSRRLVGHARHRGVPRGGRHSTRLPRSRCGPPADLRVPAGQPPARVGGRECLDRHELRLVGAQAQFPPRPPQRTGPRPRHRGRPAGRGGAPGQRAGREAAGRRRVAGPPAGPALLPADAAAQHRALRLGLPGRDPPPARAVRPHRGTAPLRARRVVR